MSRVGPHNRIQANDLVTDEVSQYRVTQVLPRGVLAVNLETQLTCHLVGDRIRLVREGPAPVSHATDAVIGTYRDLLGYSDRQWEKGELKYQSIKELLALPERTEQDVRAVAGKVGRNVKTIYRWIQAYQRLPDPSCSALVPRKPGPRKGTHTLSPEVEAIVTSVFNDFHLSPQGFRKSYTAELIQQKCRLAGLAPPHMNTIYRRLRSLKSATVAHKQGRKDQHKQYQPIHGKFPDAAHPFDVVQIDHTRANVFVVTDDEDRESDGRPWITVAMDVCTRMIVGFYISMDAPSAASVGFCVANMMCSKRDYLAKLEIPGEWPVWGSPAVLHADNAKEFRCEPVRRGCAEYDIDMHWRPVGKPEWGGHIERVMGILSREFETIFGTTFANPKERKDYDSAKMACMTLRDVEKNIVDFIVNVYHQQVHRSLDMSPIRRWHLGINEQVGDAAPSGMEMPPEDPRQVELDFMPVEMRTIQRYGVQIENFTYYDAVLAPYIKEVNPDTNNEFFLFRVDPRSVKTVYFFDPKVRRYYPIPCTYRGMTDMTRAEQRAARLDAKAAGIAAVDQKVISEAVVRNRDRQAAARELTLAARKRKGRPQRPPAGSPAASSGGAAKTPSSGPRKHEAPERIPLLNDDEPILPFDESEG